MVDYRVPMGIIVGAVAFLVFLEPAGLAGSLFISIGGVGLWAGVHVLVDRRSSVRAKGEGPNP